MPINATCQACSKSFVVPDSAAGKRFKCRSCGQPMEVPVGAGAAGAKMDQPMAPADAPAKFNESPSEAFKVNPDPSNDTALELKMGAAVGAEARAADLAVQPLADEELTPGAAKGGAAPAGDVLDIPSAEEAKAGRKDRKTGAHAKAGAGAPAGAAAAGAAGMAAAGAGLAAMKSAAAGADPGAAVADALRAITRALDPSRLVLGMAGVAAAIFATAILGWGLGELVGATGWGWLGRYGMYVVLFFPLAGILLAASAVARVDLAVMRGEAPPGPVKALLSAAAGWLPGLVPAAIICGAAYFLIFYVEGWAGKLTGISYVGPIFMLPLGLFFFLVNTAALIVTPLALWLAIPIGAKGGLDPIGPLLEALGRVRREPARVFLSYVFFMILTALVFGIIAWVEVTAATIAGGNLGFSLGGILGGGGGMGGDMNFVKRLLAAIFLGGLGAVIGAIIVGPILAAFVCGGCQEVHEHPIEGGAK